MEDPTLRHRKVWVNTCLEVDNNDDDDPTQITVEAVQILSDDGSLLNGARPEGDADVQLEQLHSTYFQHDKQICHSDSWQGGPSRELTNPPFTVHIHMLDIIGRDLQ